MLNYKEFFSLLRSGQLPQALLFDGEEEYTKDSALAQLRAKVLPEGLEEMNETILPANAGANEIVDACEMLPFLSTKRLVVVRGGDLVQKTPGSSKDEGLDRLLNYLSALPEHVLLLFFCRGKADRTKKVTARIEALNGRVDFAVLDSKDKQLWLTRELKAHNKYMSKEAGDLFLSRVDPLLTPTLQELQKLLSYVGERMNIETADVEAVIAPSVEDRLFTLFDHLINGNAQGALAILKNILNQKDTEPVQLLVPLTNRVRQMYYYKVLKSKGYADREIPPLSGIKSNMLWLYEKQTRAYSEQQLKDCLSLCIRMDYEFKSGLISDDNALDTVILSLINANNKKLPRR